MKKALLILLLSFCTSIIFAQSNLFLDNSYTVEEMITDFFDDPAITVSNVTHTGDLNSIAFFDAGNTDLGLDAGIAFCNGEVFTMVGPNQSTGASTSLGIPGDPDIDQMSATTGGSISNDAIIIEFDFTVSVTDTLHFNYVFGSEEYPEWVGTSFNDAFGFFISGPGINGSYSNNASNISMVPNSSDEVAINNVNDQMNSQYYIDNMNGVHLEYDGFTTPLPASFGAVAGETYHIKMVVADRGDSALDSGIFLSFNSLGQLGPLVPPTSFNFSVPSGSNTVEFVNESKYARSWAWDFGNGMTSFERHPDPVTYTTPGTYTVTLTTENYCCTETYSTTIEVGTIVQMAVSTTVTPVLCHGDSNAAIDVSVTGGTPPYDIQPSPSELMNLTAGIYIITITDANGFVTSSTIVIPEPEPIDVIINTSAANGTNPDGSATANATGGTGNYTYEWSNGAFGQTVEGLPADEYSVTVSDDNGCSVILTVIVESITGINDLKDFEMKVFPNPVTNYFRVEWLNDGQLEKIEILDLLGRAVPFTQEYLSNGVNILLEKNISQGTYFLKVELENGKQSFERFVVMK